jgi:hypothetical protein
VEKKKIGEKKEEDRCQLMTSALTDDFASSHLLNFYHKIAQNSNFVDILWKTNFKSYTTEIY